MAAIPLGVQDVVFAIEIGSAFAGSWYEVASTSPLTDAGRGDLGNGRSFLGSQKPLARGDLA